MSRSCKVIIIGLATVVLTVVTFGLIHKFRGEES